MMGRDEYPLDLLSAQGVLVNYQSPVKDSRSMRAQGGSQVRPSPEASALTFAQRAALVVRTDGVTHVGITCWNCQAGGHYAGECPTSSTSTVSGTTLLQYAYMLAQAGRTAIDPDWILLDSQSTMSVFCNSAMLTNIVLLSTEGIKIQIWLEIFQTSDRFGTTSLSSRTFYLWRT